LTQAGCRSPSTRETANSNKLDLRETVCWKETLVVYMSQCDGITSGAMRGTLCEVSLCKHAGCVRSRCVRLTRVEVPVCVRELVVVTEADCVAVLLPVAVAVCRSTEGAQKRGGRASAAMALRSQRTMLAEETGGIFRQADACRQLCVSFHFFARILRLTRVTDAVAVGVCVRVALGVGSDGTSQQAFVYADEQT